MGRSRRAYKKARPTVRVGLPARRPFKLKPATPMSSILPNLQSSVHWDENSSLLRNYRSVGLVSNANFLGARSSTRETVLSESLQSPNEGDEAGLEDSSDVEHDDLRSALGKKRRDGKHRPLLRLTTMQRIYVSRLILKHRDDYQAMSKDMKLNKMQHPPAALENLCKRFFAYEKLSACSNIRHNEVKANPLEVAV
eukprot:c19592_g1_i2 orf=438-1025(-)